MLKDDLTTVITTSIRPSKGVFFIINDLKSILPDSIYLNRKKYKIRQIVTYLKLKRIKNLLFLDEKSEDSVMLWHIDLENNFSSKYSLVSIILRNNIEKRGRITFHRPELLFHNFKGNINNVLGKMLQRFFRGSPEFKGRQIISFIKKKNFLFIRYHRYIFSIGGKDVKLQELGPKITLKFENFFYFSEIPYNYP